MADKTHPFYEPHRSAMQSAMRQRLDLARPLLHERTHLQNVDAIAQEVMAEFDVVEHDALCGRRVESDELY